MSISIDLIISSSGANVLLLLVLLVPLFFGKTEADLFFKIQFEIKNTIDS